MTSFLRKNQVSLAWISLYYAWWLFLAWYFLFYITQPADPFLLIVVSMVLVLLYSVSMIIQIIKTPEPHKTDYMILLGIVKLPAIIGFICLVMNS